MWSLWLTMYGEIYFRAALWPGVIFQPATLNVKAYIEFFRELINYKGKECYLIPLCQSDPPKVRVSILTFDPMCLLSREHEVLKICVFWFETHTKKSFELIGMAITLTERGSLSHSARVVRQTAMASLSSANNFDALRLAADCCLVNQLPCSIEVSSFEPIPSSRVIRGQCSNLVWQQFHQRILQKLFQTKLLAAELCCRWISYPEICRSPSLRKKILLFLHFMMHRDSKRLEDQFLASLRIVGHPKTANR